MGGRPAGQDATTEAAVTAAVAVLWYAMPDVVHSRGTRALLKAGLLVAGSVPALRDRIARGRDDGATADGGPTSEHLEQVRALTSTEPVLDAAALGIDGGPPSPRARWMPVVAVAAVVGVIAGTAAIERAVHRLGERLGARGVRAPHTRIGLVLGAASAATSFAVSRLTAPGESSTEA